MKSKNIAIVDSSICVCCGACQETCPLSAITTPDGCHAVVNAEICAGCRKCSRICPTGCIRIEPREEIWK